MKVTFIDKNKILLYTSAQLTQLVAYDRYAGLKVTGSIPLCAIILLPTLLARLQTSLQLETTVRMPEASRIK